MIFDVPRALLGAKIATNLVLDLLKAGLSHPGALGCYLRALGGVLERSWRLLECSWSVNKGASRPGEARGSPGKSEETSGSGPGKAEGRCKKT